MTEPEFIPEYDGNDMISFALSKGLNLHLEPGEYIQSMTNVYNTAIIVTNHTIWRIKPCYQIGFCIERISYI